MSEKPAWRKPNKSLREQIKALEDELARAKAETWAAAIQIAEKSLCLADADTEFSDGIKYGIEAVVNHLRHDAGQPREVGEPQKQPVLWRDVFDEAAEREASEQPLEVAEEPPPAKDDAQ